MEAIEKEINKWVLIEPMMSGNSFRIMADFAEMEVRNQNLRSRLIRALNRSRPFANFKHIIDYSDVREEWFEFRQKKYEAWVRREIRGDFEFEEEDKWAGRAAVDATGLNEAEMNEIIANEIVVDAREEEVEALNLPKSNETSDSPEVILEVSEKGSERVMDVGISKLQNIKGNEATQNAVAIWKHWDSGKFTTNNSYFL